ncbi:telomere length regulation protein TEL2 homolog [Hyperolius riggenbachi]|uniref:telomere length regulation protein TEL2 homolog n=1 Tax=Hyperolius riggenbachi TaxID=752182 RepID=UPI0035A2F3AF
MMRRKTGKQEEDGARRQHSFVRQGLLFCFSTILLSVPWERLMTDMAEEVLEIKCWVEDVADKDTDDDCRRVAVNGLILMDKLKNNFQPAPIA